MKKDGLDSMDFPPLPRKHDDLPSPNPPSSQKDLLKAILCLQQQQAEAQQRQAEDQRLFREQLLRHAAINESLEAQIAAAAAKSGTTDPDSVAKTAEQVLDRRRKLAYVPEADVNPFPRRPKTLTSRMPQLHDLHGNKTADGVVADEVLQRWLTDIDESRGKALLNTTAKQAANAEPGTSSRWKQREDKKYDKDKHDKDKHSDKKPTGGKGKGGRGGKPAADE
ncbi:hypothetical protein CYMTET_27842 [Cymbomonas tetramitiformis]|uniref:Uncharacterized protein n=1 Tax=Cymbomonas tetramitiformis TaxID=36881 RepID=A0AAE0KWT0_9CHLO|nr:hypothetical protein CYMTET_27842 [Cymbomonas tetramitiformis]